MAFAQSIATQRATQAELARLLGVSRQAINDLIRRNVLELGHDGRLDIELARSAIANRVRPSAKTAATTPVPPEQSPPATTPTTAQPQPAANDEQTSSVTSYHVAKTLRETAEARIAQLKLAELRGDLVRVADIRSAYATRAAALRESLLQIPARLASVLAAETDHARCHDLLQAELHQVLAQLQKQ